MNGGRIRGRRRLMGIGGFALVALLVVFHGGLLWHRLTDGSLLQPLVVAKWAVSVALVLALVRLWRLGRPVLRGRRAGVLWLIVALLHAVVPGGAQPAVGPVAAEGLLPAALVVLALLGLATAAAPGSLSAGDRHPKGGRSRQARLPGAGWYRVLFSRPPPAALHP